MYYYLPLWNYFLIRVQLTVNTKRQIFHLTDIADHSTLMQQMPTSKMNLV